MMGLTEGSTSFTVGLDTYTRRVNVSSVTGVACVRNNEQLSMYVNTQGLNSSGFDASNELSSLPPSATGKPVFVLIAAIFCQ